MGKDTCKDKDCLNCPLPQCKYDKYTPDGQLDTSDRRPSRKGTGGGKKRTTPIGMSYYQANREECCRKERERYRKNKDKKLAYQKKYNKRKKEEKANG